MKIWQLITRDTWCQGKSFKKGTTCALGWLRKIYDEDDNEFKEAYLKLRKQIGFRPIVGWNDSEHTEYNEVYTAFRKADI